MKTDRSAGNGTLGAVLRTTLLAAVLGTCSMQGAGRDPVLDTNPALQVKPFYTEAFLDEGSPLVLVPYSMDPFAQYMWDSTDISESRFYRDRLENDTADDSR
jgi:hypothetical protein